MGHATRAIGGALGDVFSSRLAGLSLACVVTAIAATAAAAWAAFRYLLPLIPDREGWIGWLLNAAEVLGGAGVVLLAIVLAPSVSMLVGGALFDIAAARVEKAIGASPGRMISVPQGILTGVRIAAPALALNLLAIPLYFVPVLNLVVFFGLNGYLMGREYFSLAAVRRMSWAEARAARRRAPISVFLIGLVASFLPFVAPLFGASAMTRFLKSQTGA